MKKIAVLLLLLLCCTRVIAEPINKIVFFGDSLSDNGNLYKLFLKIIPKSPPYFQGRFSNGPTWAEHVGQYYYDRQYAGYDIYAYGGATAIYHPPMKNFVSPTTLRLEVDQYLIGSLFKDKSKILFTIWIGSNDYLFDRATNIDAVIKRITWAIIRLADTGAVNFLILNLPDLSKIPKTHDDAGVNKLHDIIVEHNQKLATEMSSLQRQYPALKIHFMDINSTFSDVIANPQKYNKKYNVNIKNTAQGCWQGSYVLKNMLSERSISQDLQQTQDDKNNNTQMMTNYVLNSPSVSEAYLIGKMHGQGMRPCMNADEYLFWDDIHPTAIVHKILAQIVIEKLNSEITG